MRSATLGSLSVVLLAAPAFLAACSSSPGVTRADLDSAVATANQAKQQADQALQTAQKAEQDAQAADQRAGKMYDRSLRK
ncbi:MAG TPA: alanine-zipper protein [Stellaceae bacterium]|nr:alanine-zipper protein [Stellaceae bacterium]